VADDVGRPPNVYSPVFDDESEREGFSYRDAWLGVQAGAVRLGASLYEIEPGQTTFPYHWHAGNEEMLLVLSGRLDLRTPDGTREVTAGELVAFSRGERGAHQVINRGDEPGRFIVVSEVNGPDVCVYVDSGKVGAREHAPGTGKGLRLNFRAADAIDYWDDEEPPRI
jgi:uncharacterized cupin superfamily protein